MKNLRTTVTALSVLALALLGINEISARGGGFHGGGGWSGGRGGDFGGRGGDFGGRGGDFGRGEGEFRGDDRGEHGQGQHRRNNNNNNNNNNNTTNNYYGGGWGWGWGAADDALAGMVVGAAIASSSQPSTVIVEQQAPQQAPAYMAAQQIPGAPAYGTRVTVLPAGAKVCNVRGSVAYDSNGVWYRPYFGTSGVYYEVVSPPPQDEGTA